MSKSKRDFDAPQYHADHPRPVTRRQFVAQGFMSGGAMTMGGGFLSMFANPRQALADLSPDLAGLLQNPCQISTAGAGKIPFIAFDLAGGANIAGSNVLIGQEGGQRDFLSTNGYERQGLPGDMLPGQTDPVLQQDYANFDLGLGFHLDSAFRRGMLASMTPGRGVEMEAQAKIEVGVVLLQDRIGLARQHVTREALALITIRRQEVPLSAFLADQHVRAGDVGAACEVEGDERDLARTGRRDLAGVLQ